MKHTKTSVSLTVRHDRGDKVVVRWGEGGVLRSRSFGGADSVATWINAYDFYIKLIVHRATVAVNGKMAVYVPGHEMASVFGDPSKQTNISEVEE